MSTKGVAVVGAAEAVVVEGPTASPILHEGVEADARKPANTPGAQLLSA